MVPGLGTRDVDRGEGQRPSALARELGHGHHEVDLEEAADGRRGGTRARHGARADEERDTTGAEGGMRG